MARPFGTLKYRNADDLQDGIDKYFADCDEKHIPYTLAGLAVSLDISRQTLCNYSEKEDYFDAIKRAREMCLAYNEERLYDKEGSNGAKFWLINNTDGTYADKREVNLTGDVVFGGEDQLTD